jgi:hypothetical protein
VISFFPLKARIKKKGLCHALHSDVLFQTKKKYTMSLDGEIWVAK